MSRTTSTAIPRSAVATMAATRRNVLRGIGLSGLAVGGASLLAAWGKTPDQTAAVGRIRAQLDGVCGKLDGGDAKAKAACQGLMKKA